MATLPKVFMDVAINGKETGRLVFKLYKDSSPKTVENFRSLCVGDKGLGKMGKPLHYKGSKFHRIITGFMAQGGDFTHGTGVGGESIYGTTFKDENFDLKHTKRGQLSMANAGPNTNGSQFFITFAKTSWLDGRHTVFGELESGDAVLDKMELAGTSAGTPKQGIQITDCGELKV